MMGPGPPLTGPLVTVMVTSMLAVHGDIVEGFSLVLSGGGGIDDLVACTESLAVTALYALEEGEWVSYILGAPEFVNQAFHELYPDGLPPLTPVVVASNEPAAASGDGDGTGSAGN